MNRQRLLAFCEFLMNFTLIAYIVHNTALLLIWVAITAAALLFLAYRAGVYVLTTRKAQS